MFGYSRMESKMRRVRDGLRRRFPACGVSVTFDLWHHAHKDEPAPDDFSVCIVQKIGPSYYGSASSLEAAAMNAINKALEAIPDAK